jgi:AcrR family transcriptional regulator
MTPPPEPLTPARILEATEEVLRRYGPAKATVVDVARALGVSHGSVYRHFRTKTALREAVTERWLDQSHAELESIAHGSDPAPERLRHWLVELYSAKRRKAGGDPELFATYLALTREHSEVVDRHVTAMVGQIEAIVRDGVGEGAFEPPAPPPASARAVWDATARYHDPVYAPEWERPENAEGLEGLIAVLLRGLRAG